MEDENMVAEPQTAEETVAPETTEEEVELDLDDSEEESVEEIKARLAKAEELANNYKVRAEKAEKRAKPAQAPKATGDLTIKDALAIANAKVHEEDVDEVLDYAKFKGISIQEALKSSFIKNTLVQRTEERASSEAANTAKNRGSRSSITDDAILAQATKTGELPDSDEDMKRLIEARMNSK